jgi:acyl carrier protein
MEIGAKVIESISNIIEVKPEEISDETAIGDFPKWDSLSHLIIISTLEEVFQIQFDPEMIMDLEDVGDIIYAIEEMKK